MYKFFVIQAGIKSRCGSIKYDIDGSSYDLECTEFKITFVSKDLDTNY